MKTVSLVLLSKGRKYFSATTKGYKCKVVINSISENLELGKEVEILCNDLSVRSKYGTDLIFEPAGEIKADSIVTLTHDRYNCKLIKKCRDLGGKYDSETKAWIFSDIVADKVEELDLLFNSENVAIEIKAIDDIRVTCDSVDFCGYVVAKASGRDSGAKLGDDVAMISGWINSGGSMNNWTTIVSKDSVFRLKVSRKLLENNTSTKFEVKVK